MRQGQAKNDVAERHRVNVFLEGIFLKSCIRGEFVENVAGDSNEGVAKILQATAFEISL